jgi:hypothetical protein
MILEQIRGAQMQMSHSHLVVIAVTVFLSALGSAHSQSEGPREIPLIPPIPLPQTVRPQSAPAGQEQSPIRGPLGRVNPSMPSNSDPRCQLLTEQQRQATPGCS